jgi:GDP-L-fucose synthase
MSKILVTGGTGMLGEHLQQIIPEAHYIGSEYDLRDWLAAEDLFETYKPTHVIHLAARVGGIQDNILRPAEYINDNILINTHVLNMCKMYDVKRFTGILSTCIYPDKVKGLEFSYPMTEKDLFLGPPAPTNFSYAYAKRCLAVHIDAHNKQYGTKYNYLIPCNLYSEYDDFDDENKMHFVTALLKKIKTSEKTLKLLGSGIPLRQFMYAGDLARVIKIVLDKDITDSFNVAVSENLTIHKMAHDALKTLKKDLEIQWSEPGLNGQFRKDVCNKKMLSYIPDFKFTSFKKGIKKVYKSIENDK